MDDQHVTVCTINVHLMFIKCVLEKRFTLLTTSLHGVGIQNHLKFVYRLQMNNISRQSQTLFIVFYS